LLDIARITGIPLRELRLYPRGIIMRIENVLKGKPPKNNLIPEKYLERGRLPDFFRGTIRPTSFIRRFQGPGAIGRDRNGISPGGNQSQLAVVSGAAPRQQRAAATGAARAAAVKAARKVTPATITKLPRGAKGPGFTPFKGTDFNIRDNVYKAARSGRLRTVNDIRRAASNIENATFRAKVIAKAQRLALAAIRAGR
jgi:hypothetical protein